MPKEVIRSKYEGNSDNPEPVIRVGWSKEQGHVDVASVSLDPKQGLSFYDEDVKQWVTFDKRDFLENGWFVQLDRNGINKMIKALRTARDQAFGKDE